MAIIDNTIATGSAAYKANRDGMLALIARMRALEERTRAASAAAKDRFHKRGQLLPRERVALVLDPGSPFLELSTLAGYMFDVPDADKSVPGGGVDRRHRLRLRHPLHGQRQRRRHRCRRAAALRPRQDLARAGAGAGEQAALRAAGRKRRRQSAALPRRGFCPRRQHLSQSRAAVGGRPAGRHGDARFVHRRRRLPDRDCPITS